MSVEVTGNTATVTVPTAKAKISFTIKVSAQSTQYITVTQDSKKIHEFTGKGEKGTLLADVTLEPSSKPYVLKFEYDHNGTRKANREVAAGGPYSFGGIHLLVLASENGDDSDMNDAVAEFKWS